MIRCELIGLVGLTWSSLSWSAILIDYLKIGGVTEARSAILNTAQNNTTSVSVVVDVRVIQLTQAKRMTNVSIPARES